MNKKEPSLWFRMINPWLLLEGILVIEIENLEKHLYTKKNMSDLCVVERKCLTKHLCISVPAPIWHLICINFLQWCRLFYLGQMWTKGTNSVSKFKKNDAGTAPSYGSICDDFSEQN